jgi:hypothetical protein
MVTQLRYAIPCALLAALLALAPPEPAPAKAPAARPAPLQIGKSRTVDLSALAEDILSRGAAEQNELVRDALLVAAFHGFDADPVYRDLFAARFGSLRRPYLAGVTETQVGVGRVAPLKDGAYLVLVPRGAAGEPFPWPEVCRLVDARTHSDGRAPETVHVVTYTADVGFDHVSAALEYAAKVAGADFYTAGKGYGYTERTIEEEKDLKAFLDGTNDLLGATIDAKGKLVFRGRQYPKDLARRPWEPLGLEDWRVLRRAVREHGTFGFSLDPWIEYAALAEGLGDLADDPPEGLEDKYQDRLKKLAGNLDAKAKDPKEPAAAPTGSVQELTVLVGDLRRAEKGKGAKALAAKDLADDLEDLITDLEFTVARYEGATGATRVGACQYYTDDTAKLISLGQLAVAPRPGEFGAEKVRPIRGVPRVDGLLPVPQMRVSPIYAEDLSKPKAYRLWWGTRPEGVRSAIVKDPTISLGPVCVQLFFMMTAQGQQKEAEPDAVWGSFPKNWNARYLAIADQEPQYHLLNQIQKAGLLLVWLELSERGQVLGFLGEPEKPAQKYRYDQWYPKALKDGLIGVDVPIRFRGKIRGVENEASDDHISGPYRQAGQTFEWKGGHSGPTAREVLASVRPSPPLLDWGSPGRPRTGAGSPSPRSGAVRCGSPPPPGIVCARRSCTSCRLLATRQPRRSARKGGATSRASRLRPARWRSARCPCARGRTGRWLWPASPGRSTPGIAQPLNWPAASPSTRPVWKRCASPRTEKLFSWAFRTVSGSRCPPAAGATNRPRRRVAVSTSDRRTAHPAGGAGSGSRRRRFVS